MSTSIIDAFCLKKPVIQLKFPKVNFSYLYNESCVFFSDVEFLKNSIFRLLDDDTIKRKLKINSLQFLKEYYNIPEENPDTFLQNKIKNIKID
jgi:hypothetical protein